MLKDDELKLLEMRDRLRAEIQDRVDTVPEQSRAGGDVTNLPTHKADRDVEGMDAEAATDEAQRQMLSAIEAALDRIEEGTYGNCTSCGQPIDSERLEALPQTAFCIDCEQDRESK